MAYKKVRKGKVYLVFRVMPLASESEPNRKLVGTWVRRQDADRQVGNTPGTYVQVAYPARMEKQEDSNTAKDRL